MHIDLTDRVVIVTGAGRGIGRTLAERFAAEGSRVVALDLAFPDGTATDGTAPDRTAPDAGPANVGGTFLVSQAVAPVMQAAGRGRIINAASFAAIVPSVGSAAYAASKAAVVQFTRVLASELGPWGITVNAYAPGMVPTAMNGFAAMEPAAQDRLLDTLSLRRWETPDDVADLLLFLASDRAGYITGTLLDVSGGKLATQIPSRAHEPPGAPR